MRLIKLENGDYVALDAIVAVGTSIDSMDNWSVTIRLIDGHCSHINCLSKTDAKSKASSLVRLINERCE